MLHAHSRIWLAEVDVNLADPQQLARRWLDEHLPQVLAQRFGSNVLYLYDPQGRRPTLRDEYVAQYPLDAPVGASGELRGWELPVSTYTAGDSVHLSLLWERAPDRAIEVDLRTADGRSLAARHAEGEPGATGRRQQFDLPVYAATPAGEYWIALSPASGEDLILGSLRISGTLAWPRRSRAAIAVDAKLGDEITLVGYALQGSKGGTPLRAAPGETLTLDLYWRASVKPSHDYTVFTHLLGETHNPRTGGPLWAQHDSQPLDNGYPTSQWLEEQVIVDRHRLIVDDRAPQGEYHVEVGMYTVEDGRRLAVRGQDGQALGDRVLLETPIVIVER